MPHGDFLAVEAAGGTVSARSGMAAISGAMGDSTRTGRTSAVAISWFLLSRALPVPLLLTAAIVTADLAVGAGDPAISGNAGLLTPFTPSRAGSPDELWETALAPASSSDVAAAPQKVPNVAPAPITALLPGRLPVSASLAAEALPTPAPVPLPGPVSGEVPVSASSREPDVSPLVRVDVAPEMVPGALRAEEIAPPGEATAAEPTRLAEVQGLAARPGPASEKAISSLIGPADLPVPLAPEQALSAILPLQRGSLAASPARPAGASLDGGERIGETHTPRSRSAPAQARAALAVSGPGAVPLALPQSGSRAWAGMTAIAPVEPVPRSPVERMAAPPAPAPAVTAPAVPVPSAAPRATAAAAVPVARPLAPSGTQRPVARPPARAVAPVASVSGAAPAAPAREASRLARFAPAPAPAAPAAMRSAAASAAVPAAAIAAALPPSKARDAASGAETMVVRSRMLTRIDGKTAGSVDFLQSTGNLKVRVGALVEVLSDRYDTAQLERIRSSAARDAYLSIAELQAQGIPITYDPVYDEFNIGTAPAKPKAARKVYVDQISAPERGGGSVSMDQVRP